MTSLRKDCLTAREKSNSEGNCAPQGILTGLRWPSGADPNSIKPKLARHVTTEDDVLHIKDLPDFDHRLGHSDRERG